MKYYKLISKFGDNITIRKILYFTEKYTEKDMLTAYINTIFDFRVKYACHWVFKKGNETRYEIGFTTNEGTVHKTSESITIIECSKEEYVESTLLN